MGLVVGLAALAAVARAETARPWADGVPPAKQAQARQLLDEANKHFAERSYREALKVYQRALLAWDHPGIRFNIAECLIELDQPIEAYENLVLALRYGEVPLGPVMYERAGKTLKLLEGRLGRLAVSCEEPGAVVSLDGVRLFVAPGVESKVLRPGTHQVVAIKQGHVTQTREVVLLPEKTVELTLVLPPLAGDTPVEVRRRWAPWTTWSVVAAGVVVGASGLLFTRQAEASFDRYDEQVLEHCPIRDCRVSDLPRSTLDLKEKGETMNALAVTAYAVGGALVATGAVLTFFNQPRRVPLEGHEVVSAAEPDRPRREWYLDPLGGGLVGAGAVGLGLGVTFLLRASSAEDAADEQTSHAAFLGKLDRAGRNRTLAAASFVVGGALIAGGAVRYLLLRNSSSVDVGVAADSQGASFVLRGSFE